MTEAVPTTQPPLADKLRRIRDDQEKIKADLGQAIVGLESATDLLLGAVISGGHCLLEGVPGLAKTLLVKSLGQALGLQAARIQFTPDLMPSDITGTEIIVQDKQTGERTFKFIRGPVFANLLLADEINRTPPKTQAALMEAMEEKQVTSLGRRYDLDRPFIVVATQNPIEQEATYPLPAAQLDRFMYLVKVDYPSFDEEYEIIRLTTTCEPQDLTPILSKDEVLWLGQAVRSHPMPPGLEALAVKLARLTRPDDDAAPDFVKDWVSWGAGPRADQFMILGARARALLLGRGEVEIGDLARVAKPVLRHRILLNYQALADGVSTDDLIDRLLDSLPEFAPLRDTAATRPEHTGLLARLFRRRG